MPTSPAHGHIHGFALIAVLGVGCGAPGGSGEIDGGPPDSGADGGALQHCVPASDRSELVLYGSSDGTSFTDAVQLFSPASVPHIFFDAPDDAFLVSFQAFTDGPLCDRMAYLRLSPNGETLEETRSLAITSEFFNGFDPTLLAMDDRLVLSYTVRPPGRTQPCISLAVGDSVDDLVGRDDLLWCSADDAEAFMDSSAIYVAPYILVYIPSDASMTSAQPVNYYAKIDPERWSIVESGQITGVEMFFLGSIVATLDAGCPYRFYGTYQEHVRSACSANGVDFVLESSNLLMGADPGVAWSAGAGYRMVMAR